MKTISKEELIEVLMQLTREIELDESYDKSAVDQLFESANDIFENQSIPNCAYTLIYLLIALFKENLTNKADTN